LGRQLSRLSARNGSSAKSVRNGRTENEPTALDADDRIDTLVAEWKREPLDGRSESLRIAQQRGDVVEEDARLGKVGNVANVLFEVHQQVSLIHRDTTMDHGALVMLLRLVIVQSRSRRTLRSALRRPRSPPAHGPRAVRHAAAARRGSPLQHRLRRRLPPVRPAGYA